MIPRFLRATSRHVPALQPFHWRYNAVAARRISSFRRGFATTQEEKVEDAEVLQETETRKVPNVEGADTTAPSTQNPDEFLDLESPDASPDKDSYVHPSPETHSGPSVKHTFQTETKKILDIVANSLYTDKEIFLREIISNASDALEKARFLQAKGEIEEGPPLEIKIFVNEKDNTVIIQDTGIGMTKEELVSHLGTIARSGSKAFVEASKETPGDVSNIIGQFGVGFYSCFMVADKVDVYSLSARAGSVAHYWTSTGAGDYEIAEAEGVSRGTKVIIHLKESEKNFAIKHVVEGIVKKYSNFVGFPISLNDQKVNTVQALWVMEKNKITPEQHLEFYRYLANAYDTPFFTLQFRTDSPIDIKALFYFPERHLEKYGMGRTDPGVSLYCRKVLIQPKSKLVLPDWLRFVKGVVDSEDIPLNISRENMQDSQLIQRINNVLTKKIIKFLADQSKHDPEKYGAFWKEFGQFFKEGVCGDFVHKADIAQLLRFDTSLGENQECSLDDYISRMPLDQKNIYYLSAPNRSFALSSPYFEQFDKSGTEVLFLYHAVDDFVMKTLEKYNKRPLVSIESADVKKSAEETKADESLDESEKEKRKVHAESVVAFFNDILKEKVLSVKATERLSSSPAIVVDHESGAVRKMLSYLDANRVSSLPKQKLEVNPRHPTVMHVMSLKDSKPDLAKMIVEQVYDNALIAADLLDNPRSMLVRLNKILEEASSK